MKKIDIIFILACSIFYAFPATALPASGDSGDAAKSDSIRLKLTKEEAIKEIKETVKWEPDIFENVKEIKKETDASGKESYSYLVGEKYIKLEDLDEGQLNDALGNLAKQAHIININRVQEQLAAVRIAQQAAKAPPVPPQPVSPPQQPPSPPRIPPPPPRR